MYNGANGDTFCEVLVSRRRGTPETVKAALAIIVGLVFSAVIILLVPMFFCLFRYGHCDIYSECRSWNMNTSLHPEIWILMY
ncbi:MAG: hypothetical protein ACLR5Q_05305 [Coprococcus sp.]